MKKTFFIAFVLFSFHLFPFTVKAQEGTLVDGVAAVIGKNIVKFSDIESAYAQSRLRSSDAGQTRCDILENLILTQLLVHKGEIDSVEVSDEEVDQYVQYYLKGILRQYGSKESVRENTGLDYEELKEQYTRMVRSNLLSRRVEYNLTESVKVTPAEVTEFFNSLPTDSLPIMPERYEISEIVLQPVVSEAERDRVRTELAALRERVIKGEKFFIMVFDKL